MFIVKRSASGGRRIFQAAIFEVVAVVLRNVAVVLICFVGRATAGFAV